LESFGFAFLVGDVIIEVGLGFLDDVIGPWAPTQEAIFCVFLLKKLDEFRTFRALDWLSRVVV